MNSVHFLLLAIFAACLKISLGGPFLTLFACGFAALGMFASFVEFKRLGFDKPDKPAKPSNLDVQ